MLFKQFVIAAGMALTTATAMQAAPLEQVVLAPIDHVPAELVVVDEDGGEFFYSQADIEALGSYRLVTTTPWRAEAVVFEGGRLQDLLKKHGLDDAESIRVIAENEFETIFEHDVWSNIPILLATRVEGEPHSRRARGPIQFVVSMEDYEGSDVISERHLVWMVARIEPTR